VSEFSVILLMHTGGGDIDFKLSAIFAALGLSWPWPWPSIGSYGVQSCITHHRPLPTHQISL